jgi:tripartite-type tricarboxylate transporter receptor subunit TctC
MTFTTRRALMAQVILAGCAVLAAGPVAAQAYPNKPIRMIVPTSAGGGNDFITRTVAKKLEDLLGWTIVVENKPGASGIIATEFVAKSAPDGYTILFNGPLIVQAAGLYSKLPYDPIKDFTPLTDIIRTPLWFAVSTAKVPAKSIKEFSDLARPKTRDDSYGSIGPGSSHHLYMHNLNEAAGLNMIHVPYKGGAPAVLAVVAGEVSAVMLDLVSLKPHVASGKVRLLGSTGTRRSPLTPDVPTLLEQGYQGFESYGWGAMFLPSKTPTDIVQRLETEIGKVLQQPDVVAKFKDMGFEIGGTPQAQFATQVAGDLDRWVRLIKKAGVTLD